MQAASSQMFTTLRQGKLTAESTEFLLTIGGRPGVEANKQTRKRKPLLSRSTRLSALCNCSEPRTYGPAHFWKPHLCQFGLHSWWTTIDSNKVVNPCTHLALENPRESRRSQRHRLVGVHGPLRLHPGDAAHQSLQEDKNKK